MQNQIDIQRGGETERKILSPLIHSTTDNNGQCSADPRPGAFQGFPCFGPSSTVFPGHKEGAEWEMELPGLEPEPIWDPGDFKGRILAPTPLCWVLKKIIFNKIVTPLAD